MGRFGGGLGGLGGVLGGLGGILGRLGASWGCLGASWPHLETSWTHLGPSWRRLKWFWPTGWAGAAWVRRMRGGHSKAYIRPKLFPILNTPLGHPCQAGGRRIANACGEHRRPPMFYAGFFWKANLWRQAFLESNFEEAGWSSNSPKKYS